MPSTTTSCLVFFLYACGDHRDLHSFPTRRSSDLGLTQGIGLNIRPFAAGRWLHSGVSGDDILTGKPGLDMFYNLTPDRKSTRLNSSHSQISYAVFCLKKKRTKTNNAKPRHRYTNH